MSYDPDDDDDDYWDSDDDNTGGYSSDDSTSNRVPNIGVPGSTYTKNGRVYSSGHADTFRKCLHNMFLSSKYCDVTLVTNTATFKAHKVVLAANSTYLNELLSSTCSEALESVVSFQDNPYVTSTGLSAILEYAYLGSFQISHSSVRDILEVARHLQMKDVTKSCETFLEDIINIDNYVGLLETAREFGLTGVEERIEHFLEGIEVSMDNFLKLFNFAMASKRDAVLKKVITFISQELSQSGAFQGIIGNNGFKILMAMVKADTHGIFTDMDLINFILKWMETSPEDRLPVLSDVIKEINLLCFEEDALDKVTNLPFFKDNETVKEQISEAKRHLLEIKEPSANDLYVFRTSGDDFKFYCLASESVITKKALLDIQSRRHHKQVSMTYDHSSAVAVGDILFFIARPIVLANGREGSPCFSYNPARNVWKEHASLPSDRREYRLVASVGEVYAIGGRENSRATKRVDVYDFTWDEWRTVTPLPRAYETFTAAAVDGNIYVYGYSDRSHRSESAFLKYDQDKNEWVEKSTPGSIYSPGGRFQIGHLVACSKGLYQITSNCVPHHLHAKRIEDLLLDAGDLDDDNQDVPALGVRFYDQTSDDWKYTTLHHTFYEFDIKVVLSHMDDMFIIANYMKHSQLGRCWTRVSSLFWVTEPFWNIELQEDNFPHEFCNKVALVNIPKASIARLAE